MTDYLASYPGLSYLALVPQQYRAQVANWCGLSPTVGELRGVMLTYGKLSNEISKVVAFGVDKVLFSPHASEYWAIYWKALLLDPAEDSEDFRNEMLRYLGPVQLAGDYWKPVKMKMDQHVEVSNNAGRSFAAVPVHDSLPVGVDVDEVVRLVDTLPYFSDVDSDRTGFGIAVPGEISEQSRLKSAVDRVMDKCHIWHDVGCDATGQYFDLSGYCYQRLFTADVVDVLTLALGSYPDAKLVGVFYAVGLVYGFSVTTGLGVTLSELPTKLAEPCLHVSSGGMGSAAVYRVLMDHSCVIGHNDFLKSRLGQVQGVFPVLEAYSQVLVPPVGTLLVCMEWFTHKRLCDRFPDRKDDIVHYRDPFPVRDRVWVYAQCDSDSLLDSQRYAVVRAYFSAMHEFKYVVKDDQHDDFYASMMVGRSLHFIFDAINFDVTDCRDEMVQDGRAVTEVLMSAATTVIASVPAECDFRSNALSFLPPPDKVAVFPRKHGVLGPYGGSMLKSPCVYMEPTVVLLPQHFSVHFHGATLVSSSGYTVVFLAAQALLEVELPPDISAGKFIFTAFPFDVNFRSIWSNSCHFFDKTSCDARLSSESMYVSAPLRYMHPPESKVSVFEVSEPFGEWKDIEHFRVITSSGYFSVDVPITPDRCVLSLLRSSDHSQFSLCVGGVWLAGEGATVSIPTNLLRACRVFAPSGLQISFGLKFVADEYCFDNGGPSDNDDEYFHSGHLN